ncbi:MAG TPA: DNA polymerase III subunit gamma/tau [Pirellulales bacterium]
MAATSETEGPLIDATPERPPGEYVVVARRYRPQAFAELIGQEHVGRGLTGAIQSHRVGHAYLFTGARGVWKTSAARILAKALNCEKGPTPEPCNACDVCLAITSGDDMDVIEIDGASNRNIDDIRQLRQNVNVRPSRSRFKVYIIDEVHQLTKESFNALLKTLEEPPEHVKFVFCTTEPEKIPITILSRCQRYDFAGIQAAQILTRLEQIVAAEGVEAEHEALAIIARRAAGSMRDSQSLLEQLLAFGSQRITVADVNAMLGTAGGDRLVALATHLVERNPAAALEDLDQALAKGVDVGQLIDQLLGYFRDAMAAAVGCPADAFLHCSPSEQEAVAASAKQLGLETILAVMQILDHTLSRLRYSTHGRTLAELALVRIAHLADLDSLADLVADLRNGSATGDSSGSKSQISTASPLAKKKDELTGSPAGIVNEPHFRTAAPTAQTNGGLSSLDDARRVWEAALATVENLTADNARAASEVAIRAPNQLAVIFGTKYNFSKSFCERPDRAGQLQEAVSAVAGHPIRLIFELAVDPAPATNGGPRRVVSPRQRKAELDAEICRRPLVERAVQLFGATVEVMEKQACSKESET